MGAFSCHPLGGIIDDLTAKKGVKRMSPRGPKKEDASKKQKNVEKNSHSGRQLAVFELFPKNAEAVVSNTVVVFTSQKPENPNLT